MRTFAKTLFAALVVVATSAAAQTSTPVTTNNGTPPSAPATSLPSAPVGTDGVPVSWCYSAGFTGDDSASAAYSAASQRTHRADRAAECTVVDQSDRRSNLRSSIILASRLHICWRSRRGR